MKLTGFTLLELLIAITIVGILASIAYPSYVYFITKANRTDGQSALLDTASKLETYYLNNNTYATATISGLRGSTLSDQGYYTLSFTTLTANTYTLAATPNGSQGTNDTLCQTLTLTELGVKGVTIGPAGAPTGTASDCW